jgi:hypothetical protein
MPTFDDGDTGAEIRGLLNATGIRKNNFSASARPGVGDDTADGYEVGSLWYVASGADAGTLWLCADPASGAAEWGQVPVVSGDTTTVTTLDNADLLPLFLNAGGVGQITVANARTQLLNTSSIPTAALQDGAVTTPKIQDAAVTFAKMQDAPRGLLGRAANSTGAMALITASTTGHVPRLQSDGSIAFGTLLAGSFAANTAPLNTIANQAANTFLANATGSSAAVTAVALAASQLAGRGSTGNIAAITMGTNMRMNGTALAADTQTIGTGLATTGTVNLDLATLTGTFQTITATGNLTFTASNYAAGRRLSLCIEAGGSARTLAWPAGWVRMGAALPTSLASGAVIVVTLLVRSTTEASTIVTHQVSV